VNNESFTARRNAVSGGLTGSGFHVGFYETGSDGIKENYDKRRAVVGSPAGDCGPGVESQSYGQDRRGSR
jgi:hypothetical protein